jgi:hypothetical protein
MSSEAGNLRVKRCVVVVAVSKSPCRFTPAKKIHFMHMHTMTSQNKRARCCDEVCDGVVERDAARHDWRVNHAQ